jgi:hypothetical protein
MRVTIYGASDDLIEIEGDLREEFNADSDELNYLSFGDGTVLGIEYGKGGFWRINRLVTGHAAFEKREGADADSDYSDRVTLDGDLQFCLYGTSLVRAKK